MDVERRVIERIIQLKEVGMGYRKIAKQLKKEGLADISKSTVANFYNEHAPIFEEESRKVLDGDEGYRILKKKEMKLQKEVEQLQVKKRSRERIKKLYMNKAKT